MPEFLQIGTAAVKKKREKINDKQTRFIKASEDV